MGDPIPFIPIMKKIEQKEGGLPEWALRTKRGSLSLEELL